MSQTAASPISRPRFALAISVAVYPLVTLILVVLGPIITTWPAWLKALTIVPIMVSVMVWGVIPAINRWLGPWLRAARN